MKKVDLNVDIGEGFPHDEALLEFATSANVCCGEHAGSPGLTHATVEMCRLKGVRIGAHPGFPDRESMGRRIPEVDEIEGFLESLLRQPSQVQGYSYIKPHGAFYNVLVGDASPEQESILKVAVVYWWDWGCQMMLLSDAALRRSTRDLFPEPPTTILEGFADRAYLPNGTLVPRSEPGAVLEDPKQIKAQVLRLARQVDSICLHGDTPNCLDFAELVYKTLIDAGYEVGF